jgi:predicted ATPase/DNA-binding SARP family transcriptional activator
VSGEAVIAVRLFGGVEVRGPGGSTTLSGSKQRAIAARLALDVGRAVSVERVVDAVWGEQSPQTVRASLQVHVSNIRRALGDVGLPDVLITRPGGYSLELDADSIDVHRFDRLANQARAASQSGDHLLTLDQVDAALALWRGPPLAGAGSAPFVDPTVTGLQRVRLGLIPIAAASAIATGRAPEVLPFVESLAAEHPYDEPLWENLARLLYAQGRQADALDRLATLRRVLRDELGLDPSPSLDELEHGILTHEPGQAPKQPDRRLTATEGTGTKLPPLRSLVGRDPQIADLIGVLESERTVTLTGPGGVGKTSIAAHVATAIASTRRDGACFVDLTAIPASQDALPAVLGALGMNTVSNDVIVDDVIGLLADREQLLVFDNCEHVLHSTAAIVGALGQCSGVQVLATSREPLAVEGEVVVEIPPLSAADGAQLFLRRAQASVSAFAPDDDEAGQLVRIAELLDGLPLALELASPLVRSLTPGQIVDELARGRTIGSTVRSADARHASMHDTVGWSYRLLDEPSRTLFERFSVFEGGTDLSGVIEVCGDDDGPLERAKVVGLVDGLVTRSLLSTERTTAGMRYRMLVPVHTFAKLMLEQSGEVTEVRERHVRHTVDWLVENARVVGSPDPAPGLAALERASANLRSAYQWCRLSGHDALAAAIVASIHFLAFRNVTAITESRAWILDSLTAEQASPTCRMRILTLAALHLDQPPSTTIEQAQLAAELAEQFGDGDCLAMSRAALAHTIAESDLATARRLLTETFETAASASPVIRGQVAIYLCNHLLRAQRRDEAGAILDELLASGTRQFGLSEPELLYQCARLRLQAGDYDEAERLYRSVEAAVHRTGSLSGLSFARFGFASLAFAQGDMEVALTRFQESLELTQRLDPREIWSERLYLALTGSRLGRRDVVEAQIEPLSRSERPVVRVTHMIATACAAWLNGYPAVAERRLADAAEICATMGSRTHLIDIFEEWALVTTDAELIGALRTQTAALRDGSIGAEEAWGEVKIHVPHISGAS